MVLIDRAKPPKLLFVCDVAEHAVCVFEHMKSEPHGLEPWSGWHGDDDHLDCSRPSRC